MNTGPFDAGRAFMRVRVITIDVDVLSIPDAVSEIFSLSDRGVSAYIAIANVHMCMEAFDDPLFRDTVNQANLVVPDGLPLVWAQHLLGYRQARQVRGMDLMLALCRQAERDGTPVGFYGASTDLLRQLTEKLGHRFPGVKIVCQIAPPFHELTAEEDARYIESINESGVRILFVGLGCPKQERWMAAHKGSVQCVMLGVGAAFDFLAGNKRHAPQWMQSIGLEWLFRLSTEPRRLWRRYLIHNPRFIWHFLCQLLGKIHTSR